jgi:polysaccharide biosynthesis transport protein
MSKHYELMQEAELFRARSAASATMPAPRIMGETSVVIPTPATDDESLNLVQRVFLTESETPPRVAVFAGLHQDSGAKRLCAAAGACLARITRKPVCIVEADFRSRMEESADRFLRAPGGLSDALMIEGSIMDYCAPTEDENLWILGAGTLAQSSPGLMTAENIKARITDLRNTFDYVVIDAPSLDQFAEGVILGQLADGVVLVLESGTTRREEAEQLVADLRSSSVRLLAAVLNNYAQPIPGKLRSIL